MAQDFSSVKPRYSMDYTLHSKLGTYVLPIVQLGHLSFCPLVIFGDAPWAERLGDPAEICLGDFQDEYAKHPRRRGVLGFKPA